MSSKRRGKFKPKPLIQIAVLYLILLSVYFGVKLVQQRQSLSSSASVTGEPAVTAVLSFSAPSPANPQTVGANFTTAIVVNTAGQAIFGIDAIINFDPAKLEVVSVAPVSGNGFTSYPSTKFNNSKGEVSISGNIGTGSATPITSASLNVATITFKVLTSITTTDLTYAFTLGNRNDSNVVPEYTSARKSVTDILGSVIPLSITTTVITPSPNPSLSPTPSPIPSPSPSPSPTPTPTPLPITLTLDLQGRYPSDSSNTSIIYLSYLLNGTTAASSIPLTVTSTGTTGLTLQPGSYVFLIKSPSYLARRYGTIASPIIVDPASTTIDLSAEPLLGGDFNNDTVINEIDYSTLFLPAFASTDPAMDLDGSGQVNNLDFAIMRSNWGLIDDTIQ